MNTLFRVSFKQKAPQYPGGGRENRRSLYCNPKDQNVPHRRAGFTLIELIVSVALFSVILTTALGGLLIVIDANRQAKAIKLVVNNLNLAMEGISRELRVGNNFCEFDNGTNSPQAICNTDSDGEDIIYFTTDRGEASSLFGLNNNAVERRIGPAGPGNTALQLTGSDVLVDDLRFYIRGVGYGDNVQPSVVIVLNGHTRQADQTIEFYVQTIVSQRKLEL